MFIGRAKSGRMIGDPDNQRLDKWSSTVLACVSMYFELFRKKSMKAAVKQIPFCEVYKIGQMEFDNNKVLDSPTDCLEKAGMLVLLASASRRQQN